MGYGEAGAIHLIVFTFWMWLILWNLRPQDRALSKIGQIFCVPFFAHQINHIFLPVFLCWISHKPRLEQTLRTEPCQLFTDGPTVLVNVREFLQKSFWTIKFNRIRRALRKCRWDFSKTNNQKTNPFFYVYLDGYSPVISWQRKHVIRCWVFYHGTRTFHYRS